jgi:hypothetical protein
MDATLSFVGYTKVSSNALPKKDTNMHLLCPDAFHTRDSRLAHLVLRAPRNLPMHVLGLELVLDLDIQITVVLITGPGIQDTSNALALLDGQDVLEVEDGLFPVGVLCVGTRGELDGLVAGGELDVEPGDDGVDEVGAAHLKVEGHVEGEVSDSAGVEVEGEDGGGVRDDGFDVDRVDEGLGHGGGFEGRVVEAPDVVPDCLVRLVQV